MPSVPVQEWAKKEARKQMTAAVEALDIATTALETLGQQDLADTTKATQGLVHALRKLVETHLNG